MSAYFRNWMLVVPSAFLALSTSPVMAATATLSGSTNSCAYASYSSDANGNLSVTCSGGGTVDPTLPGTVQLSTTTYSVNAGGISTITLLRTGGTFGAMSIPVTLSGGTAVAGTNYTAPVSPVTISDGSASVSFNINTISNSAGPAWSPTTKTVGIALGAPSVGALGATSSANLTISDNFVGGGGGTGVIPAGCTVVPVTWDARLSLTFHPKSVMLNGQSFAFLKKLNPQGLNYASASYSTTPKYISISKNACDFSPALEAQGCARGAGRGNDVQLYYAPAGSSQSTGYCGVDSGDYYINVRNSSTADGPDSCPAGTNCEYWLSW